MIARRDLLRAGVAFGALGVLGIAGGLPGLALAADPVNVITTDMPFAVGSRSTRLFETKVERSKPKGVVLFSAGYGSAPDSYARLQAVLAIEGFVVLATLSVDSPAYPDTASFNRAQVFIERIADMKALSAYAARRYPGLPVLAVGHSFGTLIALCQAGGLARAADPTVKAVLGFSSPGKIPGLVNANSYEGVTVPTLIVTGTDDTVPQFATDPADHLFPIESSPAGGKYALVIAGADHRLAHDQGVGFDRALPLVKLFVEADGLGDTGAARRLAGWQAAAGDRFIVRER
ncbi:hypothetical protein [Sphingomonas sp.]|uniref:hypothetical protein n=1 Tax=Sphingomonas sp. TaxID=28214 RepID=UPI001B0FD3F1|nr:hypothetical protein [Sphingomonas sp.]MBO9714713.1 hypothetical protein [Sphingomonas sp.]